jgi:hypothetical protein
VKYQRTILSCVVLTATVLILVFCFLPHHRLVHYLSDDAYYYFNVARHISQGMGPTFDGVTVTTGFHPLYAFLLAALHHGLSLDDNGLVRSALIVSTIFFLLTGWFILAAARRLWGQTAGIWAAIFWYSNPNAILLVTTGMEGSLYACLVAAFVAFFVPVMAADSRANRMWLPYAGAGLVGGLCVVARTDALLLIAIAAAMIFMAPLINRTVHSAVEFVRERMFRQGTRALLFLAVALIPFALWLLYARHYTGTYMQASAQIKQIWRQQALAGLDPLHELLFSASILSVWISKSIIKVPILKYVALCGGFAGARNGINGTRSSAGVIHMLWMLPLLLGIAYSVGFPATWTWYYAPGLVTLTILAAGGFAVIWQRSLGDGRSLRSARGLMIIIMLAAIESYGYLAVKSARGRNRNQSDMYAVALWIRDNIPSNTRMAAWNAGVYSWYSGRTVINLDGLINNEIAPIRKRGETVGGYLTQKNVQYVVDVYKNMKKHIPDWPEDRYEVVYWHESTNMLPITVWKIKQP